MRKRLVICIFKVFGEVEQFRWKSHIETTNVMHQNTTISDELKDVEVQGGIPSVFPSILEKHRDVLCDSAVEIEFTTVDRWTSTRKIGDKLSSCEHIDKIDFSERLRITSDYNRFMEDLEFTEQFHVPTFEPRVTQQSGDSSKMKVYVDDDDPDDHEDRIPRRPPQEASESMSN